MIREVPTSSGHISTLVGYSAYCNDRCRCDDCRADWAVYNRDLRLGRAERRDLHPVPHGTSGGYTNYHCRCGRCRQAHQKGQSPWQAVRDALSPPRPPSPSRGRARPRPLGPCAGRRAGQGTDSKTPARSSGRGEHWKGYPMKDSEALNLAADHIQVYGHAKGKLGSQGEPCCALGSLYAATGTPFTALAPGFGVLWRYLDKEPIHEWNNAPERTASEVIEVLRACAVIEASREREMAEVSA